MSNRAAVCIALDVAGVFALGLAALVLYASGNSELTAVYSRVIEISQVSFCGAIASFTLARVIELALLLISAGSGGRELARAACRHDHRH